MIFTVAGGALIGGAVGLLIGRARTCSAETCNVKTSLAFAIIAGAFFGGVLAWYFVTKTAS